MMKKVRMHHRCSTQRRDLASIKYNLIWQPLMCAIFVWLALFSLDSIARNTLLWAVGASSLASSCFVVFVSPQNHSGKAHRIIGGYIVAVVAGELMRMVFIQGYHFFGLNYFSANQYMFWLSAALAVSLALFFMVVFHAEHPPAVGMALILVLDHRSWRFILLVLMSAFILSLMKYIFREHLRNLM